MTPATAVPVEQLPTWRRNALRLIYALFVFGLGPLIWPEILDPAMRWSIGRGEAVAMLGALAVLGTLGLRYPERMLPLLFFELAWKTIWLARMWYPVWAAGQLDAAMTATAWEISGVVLLYALLPWGYIVRMYGLRAGEPWRGATRA